MAVSEDDVRQATWDDLDGILAIAKMAHEEIGKFEFDEESVKDMLRRGLDKQLGYLGVVGPPGDIRGAIMVVIGKVWYAKQWQVEEVFNFVRPDYRHKNYGRRQIEFAKDFARQMQLPMFIGVFNNVRLEQKLKMYQRALGDPQGAFYFFDPTMEKAA